MKHWSEERVQKLINLEIVLILIALGADILIEALNGHDWIAAAVIVAGFCMIVGLYSHTLYLDSLFAELRSHVGHVLHHSNHSSESVAHTSVVDMPAIQVPDRPIIHVSNFLLSKNFYTKALRPLGYSITLDLPGLSMASLGIGTSSDLWIKGDGVEQTIRASFSARAKHIVDDFFEIALDAGGTEAETPGPRPQYGVDYYAAAVFDPDGYTVEAVFNNAATDAT